jgi:hypothetical protein
LLCSQITHPTDTLKVVSLPVRSPVDESPAGAMRRVILTRLIWGLDPNVEMSQRNLMEAVVRAGRDGVAGHLSALNREGWIRSVVDPARF